MSVSVTVTTPAALWSMQSAYLDSLLGNWDEEPSSLLTYDARQLNAAAAEFWAEAQAFLALHDVRFIVAGDPPGTAGIQHD